MRHWTIVSKIWGILTLSVVVGGASSAFLFLRFESVAHAYEGLFQKDVADQDRARLMQVAFKKQVQEWKDLLLRGRDADARKKYADAFDQEAQQVRILATNLKNGLPIRKPPRWRSASSKRIRPCRSNTMHRSMNSSNRKERPKPRPTCA